MRPTEDINIKKLTTIIAPEALKQVFPAPKGAFDLVAASRKRLIDLIHNRDAGMVAIVGPCSIHDPDAAMEYARNLSALSKRVKDHILVVMRTYFEKPRTVVGWKGLISDPDLDGTHLISKGLGIARRVMCDITGMGLPIATETLSPINPQYLADLITWGGIGARTSQSQTHREMVSGLSFPVGIKNPTTGELNVAVDAMRSANHAHSFLGISHDGKAAIIDTTGNPNTHLVLRGSDEGTNFDSKTVRAASKMMADNNLPDGIVIDCSHGNSNKRYELQGAALEDILNQISEGEKAICGFMLESFLKAGNQKLPDDLTQLEYGVSITDQCIDWETTEELLMKTHETLSRMGGRKI